MRRLNSKSSSEFNTPPSSPSPSPLTTSRALRTIDVFVKLSPDFEVPTSNSANSTVATFCFLGFLLVLEAWTFGAARARGCERVEVDTSISDDVGFLEGAERRRRGRRKFKRRL